ncbi:hypothetical protein Y032_0092g2551 [Ancylostoma ceylanicum]|uniref:CUB domain protein n=1 Tax=Ancylostoma ceylanicum TaxID=53326 RepID=A0A016TMB6_9BILA|nr:hypothetical protein Y032_0092g2551 [Ancylostoma ceylanicum]
MLLASLLLFSYSLQALADLCPKGWQFVPESSYCVMVSSQLFSADDASSYCKSQGSDLATLTLQSELSALTNLVTNQRLPPWMGASRSSSGTWRWNTGVSVSSTYWAKSEPSIYGDCATLRSSGMTACPCYNQQPALCKFKPQLCNGGKFGGPNVRSGTINSPGYPDQYYNNLDCYYQIEGPAGTYITITFDPFDVENYFDYVEVYDGNTTSKLIGDIDTPRPSKDTFESTTNQMLVYFHTDGMSTDKGWLATWNAKKDTPAVNQLGTNGEMSSPNYPGEYDRFLEQMYYATSPENTAINITFDAFSTELNYDYLEIYDGSGIRAPLIANLSGHNAIGNLYTSGNRLTMRFMTDGGIQFSGWHMLWNSY